MRTKIPKPGRRAGLIIFFVFLWASALVFADDWGEIMDSPYIMPRSDTHLSTRVDTEITDESKQMSLYLGADQKMATPIDAAQYEPVPRVYDMNGMIVRTFRRVHQGVYFEDAHYTVYEISGRAPRYFFKGTAPVSSRAPSLSFESARALARDTAGFDAREDRDETNRQDHSRTYRYVKETDRFHLTYNYLFFIERTNEYVQVKVDAISARVVAYHPLRTQTAESGAPPLALRAAVLDRHPLSETTPRPLSDVSITFDGAEIQPVERATNVAGEVFVDDDFETAALSFDNSHVQVGLYNTQRLDFPINPFKAVLDVLDLRRYADDLGDFLPMSVRVPFYYTQLVDRAFTEHTGLSLNLRPLSIFTDYNAGGYRCNAYFAYEMPGINRPAHLVFFDGDPLRCYPAAQSPDIVMHEFGHYIDFRMGGIEDSASSEGFADITALLFTHSPIMGKGFFVDERVPYIRDLRIDRVLPQSSGQVHFKGQALGSAFWNFAEDLLSVYSDAWVYRTLRDVFFKSLAVCSHMKDMSKVLWDLLASPASPDSANHLQCRMNKIFERHGLADAHPACQAPHPTVRLSLPDNNYARSSDGRRYIQSAARLRPRVVINNPVSQFIPKAYVIATLWADHKLIQRRAVQVSVVPGRNDYDVPFEFTVPATVSRKHQYTLRIVHTDAQKYFSVAELDLPVERVFKKRAVFKANPRVNVLRQDRLFDIELEEEGFIHGPVSTRMHIVSEDLRPVFVAVMRAATGEAENLAVMPEALADVSGRWIDINHRFQGMYARDLNTLLIHHSRFALNPIVINQYEVAVDIYEEP